MKKIFWIVIIGSLFGAIFIFTRIVFSEQTKVNQNTNVTASVEQQEDGAETRSSSLSPDTLQEDIFEFNGEKTFTLRHSGEVTKTTAEDITTFIIPEGSISIVPLSYEGIIRHSLSVQQEEKIVIDGRDAVKIAGASAKDGTFFTYILLTEGNKLYEFQGSDTFLTKLVPETFHFLR